MPTVKIRLTGSQTDTDGLIRLLHRLDFVERIEQVADLMDHMDDEDSSSAGLPDDIGPGLRAIEVGVPTEALAERMRQVAMRAAESFGAAIEFVEEV